MLKVTVVRTSKKIDLQRGINAVTAQILRDAAKIGVQLTSGTVSTKTLRQMGHPFARIGRSTRRRGTLPKLPINLQSGGLQSSMKVRHVLGTLRADIYGSFNTPYAQYILSPQGTSKMVARHFYKEWKKQLQPVVRKSLKTFFKP